MENYLPSISSFDSVCATLSGEAYLHIDNEFEDFSPLALTLAKYSHVFDNDVEQQVNHVCDLFRSKDAGNFFPTGAAASTGFATAGSSYIGDWLS